MNVIDTVKFLIYKNIKVTVISKSGIFSEKIKDMGANFIEIDFSDTVENNIEKINKKLQNPTLIHTHPFYAKDVAIKLSKYYNVPLIMTLHSINDNNIKLYEEDIDIFIAVSDLVKDFIISQDIESKKVFVTPNGIEKQELLELAKNRAFVLNHDFKNILTVSRYAKDKKFITDSIYFTLKKILEQKKFDFNWTFVGDGEEIDEIKKLAESINMEAKRDMIVFLGWQDKENIASIYKESDIFIGPGRSVIESMLFENLVIAIGSKGYVGIIDENNFLDGIYSNFGGNREKIDITLLYDDFIKVLNYSDSLIQDYQGLSKSIIEDFFDLNKLNQDLFNIYQLLEIKKKIQLTREEEKMEQDLEYISIGNRKMYYRFTPSKKGDPLFVILHGHGTKAATQFKKDGWNILAPIDNFGLNDNGSWFLGENGSFFTKDLLQTLIKKISKEYQCEDKIYIYGPSMGGYGAILHGILGNAKAVYANVPQIRLIGSNYSDNMMKRYFEYIFGNYITKENDLINFLDKEKKYPLFFLCENLKSGEHKAYKNYLEEHTLRFFNRCKELNIPCHLEILPFSGYTKNYGLKEVIEKFEKIIPLYEQENKTNEPNSKLANIAKIYYPKKEIIENENNKKYIFELENKTLELNMIPFLKQKFLYADEKCLVVQKNSRTIQVSFDEGKNWIEKSFENFKIFQIYPLSNETYLLGGLDSKQNSIVYLLDKDLNILNKNILGKRTWHSHGAIEEKYGIIMFAEYQNFEKDAELPEKISIYRSKDMGYSWEEVFALKHPEEGRHWHTLQADPYRENTWLATTGDTPSQSRWFLSEDNGDTWVEITDKEYINKCVTNRSQSAHRTTAIDIRENEYIYSTDDLMGSVADYFINCNGERKSSSKFYKASKTKPIKLEKLTNLGIHGRSMIDIKDGYIIFTEAKYVSNNIQVFYIDKSDLTKAYFLFDIYGYKRHAGTASMNSALLNDKYFYVPMDKNLIDGYQTIKYEVNFSDKKVEKYKIEDYVKLEEHLWFVNNTNSLKDIIFKGNSVEVSLNEKENVFYMLLGDPKMGSLVPKKMFEIPDDKDKIFLSFEIEKNKEVDLTLYIEFYNDIEKVTSQSFNIKEKENHIVLEKKSEYKYLKLMYRVFSKEESNLKLENLNLVFDKKNESYIYNFLQISLNQKYIKNLVDLVEKVYIPTKSEVSNSYNFKPRKDVENFEIKLPLNWDMHLFDNNWKYQLHALRVIDTELFYYRKTKEKKLLDRAIEVILDWKRDVIDTKKNFDFDREENKESFAWHDMAIGLRAVKIAYLIEEIIKLGETNQNYKYLNDLFDLALIHIEALSKQKLAPSNHAIYQIHGLMMLLRLFAQDTKAQELIKYNEGRMRELFYKQFFKEGIHKENSSRYHFLGVEVFDQILLKEIYPDLDDLLIILKKAKENCAYMHFPNNECLMTGDSDYRIINYSDLKIDNIEHLAEGLTYFNESGYIYIYEKDSMFFMNSAFLNKTHKHADFFNILLYEYGMNILVDAGKYNYMKDNPFRKYCVSTRAHNTILIDNQDYKLDTKYFFESRVVVAEEKDGIYTIKTKHQYPYFANTEHERVVFYRPKEFLVVIDKLKSDEEKNFKQIFHLHQNLELEEKDGLLMTLINKTIPMYIQTKVINGKNEIISTESKYSKGADGEIEGYRALGHNEIMENYVLYSEANEEESIFVTSFSFYEPLESIVGTNKITINELVIEI